MKSTQNRFFPRQQCVIPIEHAFHRSHHYQDSIVYNKSISGLYFETASSVEPDSIVHISVKNQPLHKEPAVPLMYFKARAKWCRPGQSHRYGIGAQLLEARSSIDAAESYPIRYACDLCGRPTACKMLSKLAEGVFLCPFCGNHFAAIEDRHMKTYILNVLMRNSGEHSPSPSAQMQGKAKP